MDNSAFQEAFEEIRKLSMDPDTVQLAIRREIALRDHIQRLEDAEMIGIERGMKKGLEQGLVQGLEQGLEQGKEQTKIGIVLKMYDESLPSHLISKLTNLSLEEVQLIIDKRNNN